MMATADALVRRSGRDVWLLGPSHSDADGPRPRQVTVHTTTPYSEVQGPFVESLRARLEGRWRGTRRDGGPSSTARRAACG